MITLAYPAFSRAQEGDGRHSKSDSSGCVELDILFMKEIVQLTVP